MIGLVAAAVTPVTVVALANVWREYRVQMRLADRVRVVNPVKQPEPKDGTAEAPASGDKPLRGIA